MSSVLHQRRGKRRFNSLKPWPWLVSFGFSLIFPAVALAQDPGEEARSCSTLESWRAIAPLVETAERSNSAVGVPAGAQNNEVTNERCLTPREQEEALLTEVCLPTEKAITLGFATASNERAPSMWTSTASLVSDSREVVACVEELNTALRDSEPQEAPHVEAESISAELLPQIEAPDFTVTAIRQQAEIKNQSDRRVTEYQGELTALGTLLGGSWFMQTEQPDLTSEHSWRIEEAQYLRQTKFADFVVGSQRSFWPTADENDYWGMTAIRRWGFKSPQTQADFDPHQRLQVVRSNRPEQIPAGASALIVSGGAEREVLENGNFFGKLREFQGGIGYRYGVTDTLTFGTGLIAHGSVKGLAEVLYGPTDIVQLQLSALSNPLDGRVDLNSRLRLSSLTVELDYSSARQLGEFTADWQLLPNFSLMASGTLEELTTGFRFAHRSPEFSTSLRAELDDEGYLLWRLRSRWDQLNLTSRRSQRNSHSELNYSLSGSGNSGHFLSLNYQTRSSRRREDDLLTIGWRYRSQEKSHRQRLWEVELGYAAGSQGSGFSAAAATAIVPGLGVRVGYQQISVTSDEPSFNLELVPNFDASGTAEEDRLERLRQQGSLWIQPFVDSNRNGRWDYKEKLYTDKTDWLLLDSQPVSDRQPDIQEQGIFVKLFPATYRLELELSQLPVGWTTNVAAYEVEVVAGSYTSVLIPIQPADE